MATQRARFQIIAAEAGVAPRARAIWVQHPLLKIITAGAVRHFDKAPFGSGSNTIVHVGVRESVARYGEALRGASAFEAAPSTYYLAALLHVFSHVMMFKIKKGNATWNPSEQNWADFMAGSRDMSGELVVSALRQSQDLRARAFRSVCVLLSVDAAEVFPLASRMPAVRLST